MRPHVQLIEAPGSDPEGPIAKKEIGSAWIQYRQSTIKCFRDGIEFGRVCHQWQIRYRAQGSRRGKGFERVLSELNIPKSTAYRWIKRYETKKGLRPTRHEVRAKEKRSSPESSLTIAAAEGAMSFALVLNEEEGRQLRKDIETLGGEKKVTKMFLEFVSYKAAEVRAGVPNALKIRSPRVDSIQTIALGA